MISQVQVMMLHKLSSVPGACAVLLALGNGSALQSIGNSKKGRLDSWSFHKGGLMISPGQYPQVWTQWRKKLPSLIRTLDIRFTHARIS